MNNKEIKNFIFVNKGDKRGGVIMKNKTNTKLRTMTDSQRIEKLNHLVSLYISNEQVERNTILSKGTREVYLKQNRKDITYLLEELFSKDPYIDPNRVTIKYEDEEKAEFEFRKRFFRKLFEISVGPKIWDEIIKAEEEE